MTEMRHRETLPIRLQLGGLSVCIALAGLFGLGAYQLVHLASEADVSGTPAMDTVLIWALTGGWVGGAGRSMFRFIWEVGGFGDDLPSYFINKWFLYMAKPAMGSAGGLFLMLTANLGLVALFTGGDQPLRFDRVCLTSILGGLFFEDVFAALATLMPRSSQ